MPKTMTTSKLTKSSLIVVLSVLRTISTASAFTTLPVTTRAPPLPSSTAVYYIQQEEASENDLFSTTTASASKPRVASFQTSASQDADWKTAIDELVQDFTGIPTKKIVSESTSNSVTVEASPVVDQQEVFSRALLAARLKMEQRKRYDQQEAFSRALLEARLKMEQRQRCDQQEVVFRNLLEARLKMEQRERLQKMMHADDSSNRNADMIFLFVGQYHAESFEEIISYAQEQLGEYSLEIVAVLGGGVIGGGTELDQTKKPAMSLISGTLPRDSQATFFQYDEGVDQEISSVLPWPQNPEELERPPSYVVFSDPFAPLDALLTELEKPRGTLPSPVIAGGVTVPPRRRRAVPSIARNGKLLAAGSLVGVEFTGNVGLMAVVAQGCRPVGPTYVITKASGAVLTGLSGESPISRLEEVAANAEQQDQELIRNGELVCGLGSSEDNIIMPTEGQETDGNDGEEEEPEGMVRMEDDFLIRQIMGFQPRSGSIRVAAGGLKEGKTFRFHVRAPKSAREDMELMIQRAKTERLFAGSSNLFRRDCGPSATAGKPLAAFQFTCVARGRKFYGETNVDLKRVEELFDDDEEEDEATSSPVAGFFANGEIGPVGIRTSEMAARDAEQADKSTFLHGFTTVVAMLCDYSETTASEAIEEVSASAIIVDSFDDAWA